MGQGSASAAAPTGRVTSKAPQARHAYSWRTSTWLPGAPKPQPCPLRPSAYDAGMSWQVYLSGEIHTDWRERVERGAVAAGLDVRFTAPVTDHAASDAAGSAVLGEQESPFWNDHIGAGVNAIRT